MAKSPDGAKDTTPKKAARPAAEKKGGRRAARSGDPSRRAVADAQDAAVEAKQRHKRKAQKIGNPAWFVPVMLGLMVIGLIWVVTFYITQERYPVASWGRWNLGAGFVFILSGFAMTTKWK